MWWGRALMAVTTGLKQANVHSGISQGHSLSWRRSLFSCPALWSWEDWGYRWKSGEAGFYFWAGLEISARTAWREWGQVMRMKGPAGTYAAGFLHRLFQVRQLGANHLFVTAWPQNTSIPYSHFPISQNSVATPSSQGNALKRSRLGKRRWVPAFSLTLHAPHSLVALLCCAH